MKNKLKVIGLFAIVSSASLFLFNSCDKLVSINVNKDYANIDYIIPAQQTAGTIIIDEEVISDLETLATSQGFDINKIESATIKSATIKINDTDPNPVTTAIITNVKASMSADNVSVAEVATDDNVHTSVDQIDLDLNGVDIAPYLKSNKFHFLAEITTNAPVPHPVPVNISLQCSFKVKPLKK
jgi:hypothetical protein